MKLTIDQLLQNSFVITINNNQYEYFVSCFKYHDLFPLPKKFEGFQIKNGMYKLAGIIKSNNVSNCSFSHIALIKYAKMLDLPFICIFEDDAYPCKDITSALTNILSDIPDDIDVLKLGITVHADCNTLIQKKHDVNDSDYFNYNLIPCDFTMGSHAYIVFNKYYDKYLEITKTHFIADLDVLNNTSHNVNSKIMMPENFVFTQQNVGDSMHNAFNDIKKRFDQKYLNTRFGI